MKKKFLKNIMCAAGIVALGAALTIPVIAETENDCAAVIDGVTINRRNVLQNVNVTVKDSAKLKTDSKAYFAVYNADTNALENIIATTDSIAKESSADTYTLNFDNKVEINDNQVCKVFLWGTEDNSTTMIPYAEAYSPAYTKYDTVTLDVAAWDDEYYMTIDEALERVFQGNGMGQVWYYDTAEKTGKSKRYYLDDDFEMYVNEVKVEKTESEFVDYVFNAISGKLDLVDKNADGKYDEIYVPYYATAIVSEVIEDGTVNFSKGVNFGINGITGMTLSDDVNYSITLDNEKIDIADLKRGDVLSIEYDVTAGFENSSFYNVFVSRNTVEGKVVEMNNEDNEISVSGQKYGFVSEALVSYRDFSLGGEYRIYTDIFGKIVDYDKVKYNVNYAIIDRTYYSADAAEYVIYLYDKQGNRNKYNFADAFKWNDKTFDSTRENYEFNQIIEDFNEKCSDVNVSDRVAEYTVNSDGKIKSIYTYTSTKIIGEYVEADSKIRDNYIGDNTVLISVDGSDFAAINKSKLIDGNEYGCYGYDYDEYTGTFGIVVITDGIGSYSVKTRIAVVDSVTVAIDDEGYDCDKLTLYTNGELINVYADGTDIVNRMVKKGDVIVYTTNIDGLIEDTYNVNVIFSPGSSYINYAKEYDVSRLFEVPQLWERDEDRVQVKLGPVLSNDENGIIIGSVDDGEKGNITYTVGDNVTKIPYAEDVKVYTYDYNRSSSKRLAVATTDEIAVTKLEDSFMINDADGNPTIIDWTNYNVPNFSYALVKVLDGKVVDVFNIIPREYEE